MSQGEALVKELKASQEKALCQASELHVKELERLQGHADQLKLELCSSKDKTQELEKLVSELQPHKERAQVCSGLEREGGGFDLKQFEMKTFLSFRCVYDIWDM